MIYDEEKIKFFLSFLPEIQLEVVSLFSYSIFKKNIIF